MNLFVSASNARKDFFKLIQKTQFPGNTVSISVDGEPKVVMISLEDFEGWQESLEISNNKDLVAGIERGLEDINKGNIYTSEEVKKQLKSLKK